MNAECLRGGEVGENRCTYEAIFERGDMHELINTSKTFRNNIADSHISFGDGGEGKRCTYGLQAVEPLSFPLPSPQK